MGDELEDEKGDGEKVGLVDVVLWGVGHLGDVMQLFRGQYILVDKLFFRQNLVVAAMPVFLIHIQQVQLNIPLRTEVHIL